MTGKLTGIAIRLARYAAMVECEEINVVADGLEGDHGGKRPDRIVSILSAEDWAAACADLDPAADPIAELPWLARRANPLLEGVRLPRAVGAVLNIGAVELEVRNQTYPCKRMEDARAGLLKTLAKDWRGGVLCSVIKGGVVRIGDDASVVSSPPEISRKLP